MNRLDSQSTGDQAPSPDAALAASPAIGASALKSWFLLAGIVALGLALRFHQVSARSLWYDEAFTYRISQYPVGELVRRVAQDCHPPLHFLLLKAWTAVFGDSLLALRSLSVLFGGMAIVGVYLFTVEAARSRPGNPDGHVPIAARERGLALWVAMLVSLSVFQIRFSWYLRMYSQGALLTVFSSWALFRALHSPDRQWRVWLSYAALALLLAYTHHLALLTIAVQAGFAIGWLLVQTRGDIGDFVRSPRLHRAVVAGVVVLAGWSPWLPCLRSQREQVHEAFWLPGVNRQSVMDNGYRMFVEPECLDGTATGLVPALCVALCVAAPTVALLRGRAIERFVAAAALVPIALSAAAAAFLGTPIFYSRYFLFAHLFILASLGLLLCQIESRWPRRIAGAVLLLLFLGLHLRFTMNSDPARIPGAQAVAAYIEERRLPGEQVIVCSPMYYLPLRYHAGMARAGYHCADSDKRIHWQGWSALSGDELIDSQELGPCAGRRLWVVDMAAGDTWRSAVPLSSSWRARRRVRFAENYGLDADMVVVEYENVSASIEPTGIASGARPGTAAH